METPNRSSDDASSFTLVGSPSERSALSSPEPYSLQFRTESPYSQAKEDKYEDDWTTISPSTPYHDLRHASPPWRLPTITQLRRLLLSIISFSLKLAWSLCCDFTHDPLGIIALLMLNLNILLFSRDEYKESLNPSFLHPMSMPYRPGSSRRCAIFCIFWHFWMAGIMLASVKLANAKRREFYVPSVRVPDLVPGVRLLWELLDFSLRGLWVLYVPSFIRSRLRIPFRRRSPSSSRTLGIHPRTFSLWHHAWTKETHSWPYTPALYIKLHHLPWINMRLAAIAVGVC